MTVSPQRNAHFALGVMALPHKIDTLQTRDFKTTLKNNVLASKTKNDKTKSAYAQSAGYLVFLGKVATKKLCTC